VLECPRIDSNTRGHTSPVSAPVYSIIIIYYLSEENKTTNTEIESSSAWYRKARTSYGFLNIWWVLRGFYECEGLFGPKSSFWTKNKVFTIGVVQAS